MERHKKRWTSFKSEWLFIYYIQLIYYLIMICIPLTMSAVSGSSRWPYTIFSDKVRGLLNLDFTMSILFWSFAKFSLTSVSGSNLLMGTHCKDDVVQWIPRYTCGTDNDLENLNIPTFRKKIKLSL